MTVKYSGRVMYPPRPKSSIPPAKLAEYEDMGYVAQLKYNGTRTLIELDGKDVKLWTRYKEPHKAYSLTPQMRSDLEEVYEKENVNGAIIIDGELMHSKTKGLKDRFIAYDILVYNGEYAIGMTMMSRYGTLYQMLNPKDWESETGRNIALQYSKNIWLAHNIFLNFEDEFAKLVDMDEIEGLVLKNPHAELERGYSSENNENWLVRCRKPHKNYEY